MANEIGMVVAGGALTRFGRRKDGSSFRDWARQAFAAALRDAGLQRRDIDALIVASESDFLTLQLNPASLLADELGLFGIRVMRAEGGGASGQVAVQAGAALVSSGQARRVAVLGLEPAAAHLSGADVAALYSLSFDAWTDGMTGIDSTSIYAMSALAFMHRTDATVSDFARVAVRNRQNARHNPNAHLPLDIAPEDVAASTMIAAPYRRLDCSPLSDGAACVILSQPGNLPGTGKGRARIVGMGSANDRVRLAERADPGTFAAKRLAAQQAYSHAGITPAQIGLAEVYDSYSGAQLQALEALGLADDVVAAERRGVFDATGTVPTNLSGGLLGQGAPVGATGVAQIVSCAHQLEGRYAGLGPRITPRFALADTHGGIATLCAVTILGGVE
ncbi:MAG: thiolase family protein [Paracoccus sp. (in: a-proteobacteria)]|uniref:thiolase family protein n=2 Tax=Paracoccus sp. TaxID=267 RepID=UPI002689BDB7